MIIASFVVFSITLVLTKSELLSAQREFVKQRYELSVKNGSDNLMHKIWNAIWNCPMCSGFWISAIVCLFSHQNWIMSVGFCFGMNWLLHCIENVLVKLGNFLEKSEKPVDSQS